MIKFRRIRIAVLLSISALTLFLPVNNAFSGNASTGDRPVLSRQTGGVSANLKQAPENIRGTATVADYPDVSANEFAGAQQPITSSNPGWTWLSPTPPASNIFNIFFLNAKEGWMVSQSAGLLHTTDGTKTWKSVKFGPPMGFNDVYFSDWRHGWAVGKDSDAWDYKSSPSYSIVWSTSNGGKTWNQQYNREGSGFGRVKFIDNSTGWVMSSDQILKTADGGATWTSVTVPTALAGCSLADLQFLDHKTGWIMGNKPNDDDPDHQKVTTVVAHTSDGGKSWSSSSMTNIKYGDMTTMCFLNASNGWVAGNYGYIWSYDAKTNSWNPQGNPAQGYLYTHIKRIQFLESGDGWAVTQNGLILHTGNGGMTWSINAEIPQWSLLGLAFTDSFNGWVFGPYGVVYHTEDGGLLWKSMRQGTGSVLNSIAFSGTSKGWAAGMQGTIMATNNSGKTWSQQETPVSSNLNGISFVGSLKGWAVGNYGVVLHTTDGGKHWVVQNSGSSDTFSSVSFANSKTGWITSYQGSLLNTSDGGKTWTEQNPKGTWQLTKVFFHDTKHGWATSAVNDAWPVVLRTEDGGVTWNPVEIKLYTPPDPDSVPSAAIFYAVHFISPTTGWISGGYAIGLDTVGIILKTTDGGKTWAAQRFDKAPHQALTSIRFANKNNGFAMGENGLYYTTTDGGANWKMQVRPCPGVDYVNDIIFVNSKTGYAVGTGGAILKTTTGGR